MHILRACLASVLLVACSGYDGTPPPPAQPRNAYPPPGYYYPPPAYTYAPPPPGYTYAPPPPQPAPAPTPQPAPSSDRFAAARQQCVTLTNQYRARVGLGPLARRPDMEACADAEAASDGRSGKAHGAFGICRGAGAQNECPGWGAASPERSLADCLEMMFNEGPGEPYVKHGHYINMTGTRYTGVSCGFAIDGKGSLWVVQDYF